MHNYKELAAVNMSTAARRGHSADRSGGRVVDHPTVRLIKERMSDQTPHQLGASGAESPHHYRQSAADSDEIQQYEADLIRFAISGSLLAGLAIAALYMPSLELAMLAATVGAAIIMVQKGSDDPQSL